MLWHTRVLTTLRVVLSGKDFLFTAATATCESGSGLKQRIAIVYDWNRMRSGGCISESLYSCER